MKVWRLHVKQELTEGPYRRKQGPRVAHLLGEHKTAWEQSDDLEGAGENDKAVELRRAFDRACVNKWVFGWSTEARMRSYVADTAHWAYILGEFDVTVLQVCDFYVLPDGQVMFNPATAADTGETFLVACEHESPDHSTEG